MEAFIFGLILKALWNQASHDAKGHQSELHAALHRKRVGYECVVLDRRARRKDR